MDEMFVGVMVDFFDKYASDNEYDARADQVVKIIRSQNPKAKNVLELACGTGRFTKRLADAGFVVTATDISQDEVEKAQSKGINATFSVADMSKLDSDREYDVIGCFWESFRYLSDFDACQDTIGRVFRALRAKGLFFVDFACFPPTTGYQGKPRTIDIGNGLCVTQQITIVTRGDYDIRSDVIRYEKNGKDITGTTISWNGKKTLLKPTIERSPVLRIKKEKMVEMLEKAGFKNIEVRSGFVGYPESTLFVAQKNWA